MEKFLFLVLMLMLISRSFHASSHTIILMLMLMLMLMLVLITQVGTRLKCLTKINTFIEGEITVSSSSYWSLNVKLNKSSVRVGSISSRCSGNEPALIPSQG